MRCAARRWKKDLLGFSGAGGLSWLSSVLCARHPLFEESLTCTEVASPQTRYLNVAGEPVAYREHGDGPTAVVLLHGFGGRCETWSAIQPTLATHHRTIAIDLWGFGASGRPAWATPRDWSRQVFGVMDALGIDRAVFVSHSLGGRVSLMCAAQAPERLRGLALLDADWGHVPHGYLLAWAIAHSPFFPTALRRLRSDTRHIARLMRLAYGRAFSVDDALVEQYVSPLRVRGTAATLVNLGRAALDSNISGIPATLRCPALVIWGEDDYIIPVEWAAKLAHKLPTAALVTLPGIGHFPQEEAPDHVLAHLQPFIAQFS